MAQTQEQPVTETDQLDPDTLESVASTNGVTIDSLKSSVGEIAKILEIDGCDLLESMDSAGVSSAIGRHLGRSWAQICVNGSDSNWFELNSPQDMLNPASVAGHRDWIDRVYEYRLAIEDVDANANADAMAELRDNFDDCDWDYYPGECESHLALAQRYEAEDVDLRQRAYDQDAAALNHPRVQVDADGVVTILPRHES